MNTKLRKKIKKILLINPHGKITITKEGSRERKLAVPPLGIAYLGAQLLKHGYDVEVLDIMLEGYENEIIQSENSVIYGLSFEDCKKKIQEINPDAVGISCLFSNRVQEVLQVCEIVKEVSSQIGVILGGQHPSGMPELILNKNIDYILAGESDLTLIDFLNKVNNNEDIRTVEGLILEDNNSFIKIDKKNYPKVEDLPYPAWYLFNLEKYWDISMSDYEVKDGHTKKFMVMITSRGCPHNCYFCTSTLSSGRVFREREIEDVINEIKLYKEKYQIDEVQFWDDNFFVNKKRLKKLLRRLIEEFPGMSFETPSGTEVNALDDEVIELLAKAGFYKIFLAIESPNEAIQQEYIDKKVTINKIPQVVQKIKDAGMIAEGSFMVGFPQESKKEIDHTFNIASQFGLDRISFAIVNPLPGTELYDECLEKGLLYDDFNPQNIRFSNENIKIEDIPRGYISKRRREVWLEYMSDKIDVEAYEQEKLNDNNSLDESKVK